MSDEMSPLNDGGAVDWFNGSATDARNKTDPWRASLSLQEASQATWGSRI